MARTPEQQAALDKMRAERAAAQGTMSNKDYLRSLQGVSSSYQRLPQTPSANRYIAPAYQPVGGSTQQRSVSQSPQRSVSQGTVTPHTSLAEDYDRRIGEINDPNIIRDIRTAYEPGMENIRGAYEEGRDVAERTFGRGIDLADQGLEYANQLTQDQLASTERNRGLAASRVDNAFNELINQTNLSKTDVERSLQRRREESQLAQDEARTAIEEKLPASLERTRSFLAQRGALSTTQAATEMANIERDQNNQLAYLERQGAIDMQEIAGLEQDLTRTYNESLVNFTKMKTDELTGIENQALDEISAIQSDQRLSVLERNREVARIQSALEAEQNRITTEMATAEKENENQIRTELINRRSQLIEQATQGTQFAAQDIQNQFQERTTTVAEQQNQMYLRAQEAALTGIDPATGQPTTAEQQRIFDNVLAEADRTGMYQGQQTIAGRAESRLGRASGADITGIDPATGMQTAQARQFFASLGYDYDSLDQNQKQFIANNNVDWFNARTSRMNAERQAEEQKGDPSVFFDLNVEDYTPEELSDYALEMIGNGSSPLTVYERAVDLYEADPTQDTLKAELEKVLSENGLSWDARIANLPVGQQTAMLNEVGKYWEADKFLSEIFGEDPNLQAEDIFGPISGRKMSFTKTYLNDEDKDAAIALINNYLDMSLQERKDLFGATLTDNELKSFKDYFGDVNSPSSTLIANITEFRRRALESANRKINEKSDYIPKRYNSQLESAIQNKYRDNDWEDPFLIGPRLPDGSFYSQKKNDVTMSYQQILQSSSSAPANSRGSIEFGGVPYTNRTHCGMYVNDVLNAGVGNSYDSKKAIAKYSTPVAGGIFAKPTNDQWGHVGIVEDVQKDKNGKVVSVTISEANYDDKVRDDGTGGGFRRITLPINSPYLAKATYSRSLIA